MYVKRVTYTDFNGNERIEDLHFHIKAADLQEEVIRNDGTDLEESIKKIIREKDANKMMDLFKSIILKSYGEKSEDGKYFVQNKELAERFTYTNAYDVFIRELLNDADLAAEFVNGVLPKKDLGINEDIAKLG